MRGTAFHDRTYNLPWPVRPAQDRFNKGKNMIAEQPEWV